MTTELKKELIEYVLLKSPVWLFNKATRSFSTQRLYSRYKRELMSDYKELMPGNLYYAIVMAEAFRDFQVDEIACKELRHKIDALKYRIKLSKPYNPEVYNKLVDEHNTMVVVYDTMIQPQQRLISLYKKVQKAKSKQVIN